MGVQQDRYARQSILKAFGPKGQERLGGSTAVVIGCGGLGCNSSSLLARAGVGHMRLVDADSVEEVNLHRQVLFTEDDARAGTPKALAAARKLTDANSFIKVEGICARVTRENIRSLITGTTMVIDGTDNAESRYVINDACAEERIPWVYGGSIETRAVCMAVKSRGGPCLRCAFPNPPAPGAMKTCREIGVLNAAVSAAASMQAAQAVRYMATGEAEWGRMMSLDVWTGEYRDAQVEVSPVCPVCGGIGETP